MNLEDLKPAPYNPRSITQHALDGLTFSMDRFGDLSGIVWNKKTDNLVCGHQRLRALREKYGNDCKVCKNDGIADDGFHLTCGEYTFPIRVVDWDLPMEKAANLAANATHITGNFTLEVNQVIDDVLKDLPDIASSLELDLLKINIDDVEIEPNENDDKVPEVKPGDSRCKPGDLWILGEHRLLCGDATNVQHVDKLTGKAKMEMCFTDPPYGVNYEGGHFHSGDVNIKRKREKMSSDSSTQIYTDVIPVIAQVVDGPCYTWYASSKGKDLYNALDAVGEYHAMIVWHKTNATYAAMNAQYKQRHEPCVYWKPKGSTLRWCGATTENTLWELKRDAQNSFHPTQKPVELSQRAISNHKAETVLDLFGGSGSTLIACEKLKRKCFMMEIDPHYCSVILKRWEDYTKKKAVLS